jgi:hypothetical protein
MNKKLGILMLMIGTFLAMSAFTVNPPADEITLAPTCGPDQVMTQAPVWTDPIPAKTHKEHKSWWHGWQNGGCGWFEWGCQERIVTDAPAVPGSWDGLACKNFKALTRMYVYYSAVPFFGETNTLWIFSSVGIPSVERVKYWAGGVFPDGFDVVKGGLMCTGVVYDDDTDKGYFECDATMAWTGERRGYLRNDPDGPAFDLLPKIERYNDMLAELGKTPSL